jgi:hypothetical protein
MERFNSAGVDLLESTQEEVRVKNQVSDRMRMYLRRHFLNERIAVWWQLPSPDYS